MSRHRLPNLRLHRVVAGKNSGETTFDPPVPLSGFSDFLVQDGDRFARPDLNQATSVVFKPGTVILTRDSGSTAS